MVLGRFWAKTVLHLRWILSPTKERDYPKRKNEPRFGEDECNEQYMWLIHNLLRITLATPWTIACQSPLPMEFSRQECWNGLPFPSPRNLPSPGIELWSPALQADSLLPEPPGKPEDNTCLYSNQYEINKNQALRHFCIVHFYRPAIECQYILGRPACMFMYLFTEDFSQNFKAI